MQNMINQHITGNTKKPQVCSCFGVGRNTILDAIRSQNLKTARDVGVCLKAGTNCGSCVPEIKSLIAQSVSEAA